MRIPRFKRLRRQLLTRTVAPRPAAALFLAAALVLTGLFIYCNGPNLSGTDPPAAGWDTGTQTAGTPEKDPAVPGSTEPPTGAENPPEGPVIAHHLPEEAAQPQIQYTAHFARNEFICDCQDACNGFPAEMDPAFMGKLEALRQALNRPVVVTSGLRCAARNAEVGGIADSWHLTGHAADIYCPGVACQTVAAAARDLGFGVIVYPAEAYCHVEYRG